jgi:MFS family permease
MSTSPAAPSAPPRSTTENKGAGKVVFATFIGSAIEWYDFFLYAACAALVFGPQFFPAGNDTAAQLGAFATFTFGFIARPLGGIIAGHLGDRIGRKKMLVLSLYVMGAATVLVGCVPNFAAIGTILLHASTSFAWAAVPPLLTRSFPNSARYTGISMAYQLGSIVGGGLAPLIATSLIANTGKPVSVAVYVSIAAVIMAAAALLLTKFRVHQDTVR